MKVDETGEDEMVVDETGVDEPGINPLSKIVDGEFGIPSRLRLCLTSRIGNIFL